MRAEQIREAMRRRGDPLALVRAALAVAAYEHPRLDPEACLGRIQALADAVRARLDADAGLGDRLYTLNTVLFQENGFTPVEGFEVDACLIDQAMARQRARPVVLGILYLTLGRLLGIPMKGVPFPGRFLVRPLTADALCIDPAAGGLTLSREDLELLLVETHGLQEASAALLEAILRGTADGKVITRLLHDLRRAYAEHGKPERALAIADCILELAPHSAGAHRERARLLEKLDCGRAATADYQRYLELAPNATDGSLIMERLQHLHSHRHTLH